MLGAVDRETNRRAVLKEISKRPSGIIPHEIVYHSLATVAAPDMVAQLYDWYDRGDSYILAMEYPENSIDLFDLTMDFENLEVSVIQTIMIQVVETVLKLRSKGIMHCDIKDENVLVDTITLKCKFIDFGWASEKSDEIVSLKIFYSIFEISGILI